ncbi:hypothetical protein Drorol1_Dr00012238 [Drosera rotundifolia]
MVTANHAELCTFILFDCVPACLITCRLHHVEPARITFIAQSCSSTLLFAFWYICGRQSLWRVTLFEVSVDGDCKSRGAVHLLSLRLRAGVLDHMSSLSRGTSTRHLNRAELLSDSSLCFLRLSSFRVEPASINYHRGFVVSMRKSDEKGLMGVRKESKKELLKILWTEAAIEGIEVKAGSRKHSTLWSKVVLEALDGA